MVTNGLLLSAQHSTGTVIGGTVLTGLVIVFLVLLILIGVMYLLGVISSSGQKKQEKDRQASVVDAPNTTPTPVKAPPVQAAAGTEDEETVAVIAAAIGAYLSDSPVPYAITSVTRAKDARPVWGFAGMTQNTRPF